MYYKLIKLLNNIEIINNFSPRYLMNPKKAFKYNNKYYHSIDEEICRYCDLKNVIYITENFYLFQKLRNVYEVKFLPYINIWDINYNESIINFKKETNRIGYFDSWRTYILNNENTIQQIEINNISNNMFYDKIYINYLYYPISISEILYCIGLSNEVYLTNKLFLDTVDKDTLYELCDWLNCNIENDMCIKTNNLNINNFNKLINFNNTYILDYILNQKKHILKNMSYLDFLNSDIW